MAMSEKNLIYRYSCCSTKPRPLITIAVMISLRVKGVLPCPGDGAVDDPGDPEGIEGASDDPNMADRGVRSVNEESTRGA